MFKEKLRWVVDSFGGKKETKDSAILAYKQVIAGAPDQLATGIKLGEKIAIENADKLQHLTFVAMGGSCHPGFIFKTYLENIGCRTQVNICRDYTIPPYISKKGFLFIVSYSGNTEETLAAYRDAYRQGYRMIVLTAGGKLKEYAEKHGTKMVVLPSGFQPRQSFYLIFGALLQILQNSALITTHAQEVKVLQDLLRSPTFEKMGQQIAHKVGTKMPIFYTTPKLGSLGQRWKISFNENSKVHSFYNILPELNHNEINANVTKEGNFHFFLLADQREKLEHQKRIRVTKQILQEYGYEVTELVIKGPTYFTRLLAAVHIGDWASYYLALEKGTDPIEVEVVERLKKLLKD